MSLSLVDVWVFRPLNEDLFQAFQSTGWTIHNKSPRPDSDLDDGWKDAIFSSSEGSWVILLSPNMFSMATDVKTVIEPLLDPTSDFVLLSSSGERCNEWRETKLIESYKVAVTTHVTEINAIAISPSFASKIRNEEIFPDGTTFFEDNPTRDELVSMVNRGTARTVTTLPSVFVTIDDQGKCLPQWEDRDWTYYIMIYTLFVAVFLGAMLIALFW